MMVGVPAGLLRLATGSNTAPLDGQEGKNWMFSGLFLAAMPGRLLTNLGLTFTECIYGVVRLHVLYHVHQI